MFVKNSSSSEWTFVIDYSIYIMKIFYMVYIKTCIELLY